MLWAEASSAAGEIVLLRALLISDSGLEFQIFSQSLPVGLPPLIHTFTFGLSFPNVQACPAIVQTEGSEIFHSEYVKGAAA